MKITAMKYCLLILLANSLMLLVAWGVARGNDLVEHDRSLEIIVEHDTAKK